jgi:hypothetical protein
MAHAPKQWLILFQTMPICINLENPVVHTVSPLQFFKARSFAALKNLNQGTVLLLNCQQLLSMAMLDKRFTFLKIPFLIIPMNPLTDKSHKTVSLNKKVIPMLVMLSYP